MNSFLKFKLEIKEKSFISGFLILERLFFRDSTALFNEKPKKLGTVQHFCNPEEQKCCTVPKFLCLGTKNLGTVQHFYSPEEQKCCTVPKFFCTGTRNLGTVQHFCSPDEQKCCTVPNFLA